MKARAGFPLTAPGKNSFDLSAQQAGDSLIGQITRWKLRVLAGFQCVCCLIDRRRFFKRPQLKSLSLIRTEEESDKNYFTYDSSGGSRTPAYPISLFISLSDSCAEQSAESRNPLPSPLLLPVRVYY